MTSQHSYESVASCEEKGLLEPGSCIASTEEDLREPRRSKRSIKIPVAIHAVLVLCYVVAASQLWTAASTKQYRPTQKYALAREALEYELTYFEDPTTAGGIDSIAWSFAGKPRPQLEAAWDNLLKNADIRVTNEEMRFLGREDEGMRLTDGSGYYAQMAVHHNLHCLRGFHKFMNVNHYYPNVTVEEYQLLQLHNVHCLDMLRQAIMCQGDTTPLTMTWDTKLQLAVANWTTPHECISWNKLDDWAEERHVDMSQPGVVDIRDSVGEPHRLQSSTRVPIVVDFDG